MILQIVNNIPGHYEIIESIIVKHYIIINNKNVKKIYLKVNESDESFRKYIEKKYPDIIFDRTGSYHFYIDCTVYPKNYEKIIKLNPEKHFFISHEMDPYLKVLPNVFYLTPLAKRFIYADVMPHNEKRKINKKIPIYAIQGHFGGLHARRRNLNLLLNILKHNYKKKFILKFVGRGEIPEEFTPYLDKIKFIQDLDFDNYHKQFLDVYAMFSLTLKDTNKQYYKNKLTSTVNYIRGYNLKAIVDVELNKIYNFKDVETYTNDKDIVRAFTRTLNQFYNKYHKI